LMLRLQLRNQIRPKRQRRMPPKRHRRKRNPLAPQNPIQQANQSETKQHFENAMRGGFE
jgi:hypothetical protein